MSTPPEQPSASSPYSSPSTPPPPPAAPSPPAGPPPAGPPAGQPPGIGAGGYGTPVPPQHNPYAQPGPYGPPTQLPGSPYGPVAPGYPAAAPAAASPGGARSSAGKAVLWAVVGAAVASALWAGGTVLLGGGFGSAPGLHGYHSTDDLCAGTDLSPFKKAYPQDDTKPGSTTIKGKAMDEMSCSISLKMDGSEYTDAYLSIHYELHRKTDPGPDFADHWQGYSQLSESHYVVKPLSGFGEEAYLVTEDSADSTSGSRDVAVGVRDGGMSFSMNWTHYLSSLDDEGTTPPTVAEATRWVEDATKATLAKLKKSTD